MLHPLPKLYRVYFSNNEPLFTEFYSDKIYETHPVGVFGKKLISGEIFDFVIVLAMDGKDALIKAKQYQRE